MADAGEPWSDTASRPPSHTVPTAAPSRANASGVISSPSSPLTPERVQMSAAEQPPQIRFFFCTLSAGSSLPGHMRTEGLTAQFSPTALPRPITACSYTEQPRRRTAPSSTTQPRSWAFSSTRQPSSTTLRFIPAPRLTLTPLPSTL